MLQIQIRLAQHIALLLGLWLALATNVQAATYADPAADIDRVIELTLERRSLMRDVAAWKWVNDRPITDASREQALLDQMRKQAQTLGLDPDALAAFFELQIRWAREIQEQAQAEWRKENKHVVAARDLNNDLRPALDRIGVEMLRVLYVSAAELQSPMFQSRYAAHIRERSRLSAQDADEFVAALAKQRRVGVSTLERIRASGVLRVGLPGDYAPFAAEQSGELQGIDVQLLTEFAAQEKLQLRFVHTSWTSLLKDFQADLFDIAAGGISITPERSAVAAFSTPYHSGGKTPIVRCGEEKRFDTLQKIDQPGVRVVVNPGGTNERFAREHFSHASIQVHPDNRTVFDEIVARRADVMVTDDVEVNLQIRRHRELCGATAETFTHDDKAWLLSNDAALVTEVNGWIGSALQHGEVKALLTR